MIVRYLIYHCQANKLTASREVLRYLGLRFGFILQQLHSLNIQNTWKSEII